MTYIYIILGVLLVVLVMLSIRNYQLKKELKSLKNSIVEIVDKKPSKNTSQAYAMQLSNELNPHIKEENDTIKIKVVKQ